MKILLLFPPGWNVHSPHIALPILKSQLESKCHEVRTIDLNVEFYDYLLSSDFQNYAKNKIQMKNNPGSKIALALLYVEETIKWIDKAKIIRRSSNNNLISGPEFDWSERMINQALFVASCTSESVNVSLKQIRFDFNIAKKSNIEKYVNNLDGNIFLRFYEMRMRSIIREFNPDVIGISLTANTQLISTVTLIEYLHSSGLLKNVKTLLGGNYLSRIITKWKDKTCELFRKIDYFINGEGEEAVCSLIEALEGKRKIEEVENLIFEKNNHLIRNKNSQVDINKTKYPNFSDLDLSLYFVPEKILPIYATRGCPNKCTFCAIPNASGTYRVRSAESVFNEMVFQHNKYGVKYFYFVDETLPLDTMSYISDKIAEIGYEIYWTGETRFNNKIDEKFCKKLREGGCRKLQFGLESYNQRILNLMKKNIKLEYIERNLISCLSNGISVHLFWMFGFPGELSSETAKTANFVSKILNESRDKYNNPFSTTAMGPFGLDIGSEISAKPEMYGIKINISNEDYELSINLDYDLIHSDKESITRLENMKQKRDIVQVFEKIDANEVRKIFSNEVGSDFWHFYIKENYDEITFIFNSYRCLKNNNLVYKRHNKFEKDHINEYISIQKTKISIFNEKENGGYYYVYNSINNRIITLSEDEYKMLSDAVKNKNFHEILEINPSLLNYLHSMGVLYIEKFEDFEINDVSFVRLGRHIRLCENLGKEYILDLSNGKIMDSNVFVKIISNIIANVCTVKDLYMKMNEYNIKGFDHEKFIAFIKNLAFKKVIYFYEEVRNG